MTTTAKIRNFTDLFAWQKSHELVLLTYKLTAGFPQSETYALADQMKRAAVSVSSNIAEGFSRRTNKEKLQFFNMSLGSTTELESQYLIARDLRYVGDDDFAITEMLIRDTNKLINGLIKKLRSST
jgi:four helix bundle protein